MAQTKKSIIKNIKRIVHEFGSFSAEDTSESGVFSPVEMSATGHIVGLADYFNEKGVIVGVYDTRGSSCDSIDEYDVLYEDVSIDILAEIERVAQDFEAIQLKTEKRISN